jgi:TonB family protein
MTITMLGLGAWVFDVLAMSSLKALALALPAWAIVRLLRPIRPAMEHGVWTAVLIAMLLLPLTGLTGLLSEETQSMLVLEMEAVAAGALAVVVGGSAASAVPSTAGHWQSWVGLGYLMVLCAFIGRLALGRWRVSRFVTQASEITDAQAREICDAVSTSSGVTKRVALLASSATQTPVTFGCFRPAVILPSTWPEWPTEKLRGVLAHELSHIERWDAWIASTAAVNCSLFWFHPISWWLKTRLTTLAELACDDRSVLLTKDRESYAETLLSVASLCQPKDTQPAWPAPAMARTSRVTKRIGRILSGALPDTGLLGSPALNRLTAAMAGWLLIVGSVSFAPAQQGITLSGTVQDASGGRIPEAMVFVSDAENEGGREVTRTRADGTYSLTGLQAGTQYNIEVRSPGFRASHDVVTLSADQHLDVSLEMGGITEAVVVSAKRLGAPPTPERGAPQRVRVGGNVQKAKLAHHVSPRYPLDARSQGIEGTVLMEAVISKGGVPLNLTIRNTLVDQRLVQAALEAVRQWRYKPTELNGQPIEVATTVTVAFLLTD